MKIPLKVDFKTPVKNKYDQFIPAILNHKEREITMAKNHRCLAGWQQFLVRL